MLIGSVGEMIRADETPAEKTTETTDSLKRTVEKKVHHVKEAMCAEGDAKCLAYKAKHRVQEGSEYVKDKAKENTN